jgi:hypothetical protein
MDREKEVFSPATTISFVGLDNIVLHNKERFSGLMESVIATKFLSSTRRMVEKESEVE